jgi:hypothetical protein
VNSTTASWKRHLIITIDSLLVSPLGMRSATTCVVPGCKTVSDQTFGDLANEPCLPSSKHSYQATSPCIVASSAGSVTLLLCCGRIGECLLYLRWHVRDEANGPRSITWCASRGKMVRLPSMTRQSNLSSLWARYQRSYKRHRV